MLKSRRLNQKGQTSVEYILLVGVMITVSITFFKKVEDFIIKNPNSYINKALGGYERAFRGNGSQYKTFTLRR